MANWAQFGHFHLGVYSLLWPAKIYKIVNIYKNVRGIRTSVRYCRRSHINVNVCAHIYTCSQELKQISSSQLTLLLTVKGE